MKLLEIEPGHFIAPDLVTEVRCVYAGHFDFYAEIVMAVGPSAQTTKHAPPGDCIIETNGCGQLLAQSPSAEVVREAGRRFTDGLAALIGDYRTGEPIELFRP